MTDQEIYDVVSVHVNSEQEVTRKLVTLPLVKRLLCREIDSMILKLSKLKSAAEEDNRNGAYIKGVRDSIKALEEYERQWK